VKLSVCCHDDDTEVSLSFFCPAVLFYHAFEFLYNSIATIRLGKLFVCSVCSKEIGTVCYMQLEKVNFSHKTITIKCIATLWRLPAVSYDASCWSPVQWYIKQYTYIFSNLGFYLLAFQYFRCFSFSFYGHLV